MLSNFICGTMQKNLDKSSILHACAEIGSHQHVDSGSIFGNKTCYPFKYPPFFEVKNFGNTLAIRLRLFFPNVSNSMHILKMQQNISGKRLLFKINAFELVAVNFLYYDDNTQHWQTMVQHTLLRLQILKRAMLSDFICRRMLKKYNRSSIFHTFAVTGTRQHGDYGSIFGNKTFYSFKYPPSSE